ncbi:hypothetical protein LWI28_003257 [Acer negundo]|uniref:Tetratricopeptide repeat protein n=1 Tax=Acer negundo TaxID=4023 RepID=A0AAD5ICN7_ACENE|nr:hypothetical protein LWI28_003257 [Acer negundo]
MCKASALDQNEVAGKVVLCDNSTKIDVSDQMEEVERAGAYAGIFLVDISDLEPDDFIIPSLILDTASGTLSERRGRPKGLKNKIRPEIRRMLGKVTLHYAHARFKEAKSVLTEVLMLNPCLPNTYHTLGLVYDTIGNAEKAAGFLRAGCGK